MKKFLVLALLCLSFFNSFSQNMLEIECYLSFEQKITAIPLATFYSCQKNNYKLRMTTLGIVTPNWGEGLVGATWFPKQNFAIGHLAGIETAPKLFRNFTYIRYTPNRWFFLAGIESSLSEAKRPWYRIEARHEFSKNLWVGITVRKRFGSGMRFQWQKDLKNGNTFGFHVDGIYNWQTRSIGSTIGLFFIY